MDKQKSQDLFSVGKIIGFHGLKGIAKVFPTANNPTLLLKIKNVQAEDPVTGEIKQLKIRSISLDKRLLFISFVDYPDRTSIEPLVNFQLFVEKNQIAELEPNEFWVKDLVGLEVYTEEGRFVGTVSSIIESATDLIEISPSDSPDDKTILVPFVKDIVPKIDMAAKRIEVKDIPGLLVPQ